jgi:hypothetical protein
MRHQKIAQQIARGRAEAVEIVKVRPGQGA